MDFSGKTVLITGASRGIGEASARLFAEAGANVALVARGDAIIKIAQDIGEQAIAISCDVSDYASVENAVAETITKFGGLDILINNAGVVEPIAHMMDSDPAEWAKVIDINLNGVYYGMRAAVPHMVKNGGGTVLTISSGAAHNPIEGWSHYCSSKAGVAMLTRMLDTEYRAAGIRAMGLSPGTVATQMQREIKASGINPISKLEWSDHVPPEWPARTLMWMAGAAGDGLLGSEVSLRDEQVRKEVGLI
jgi:NAD(P)-dependent dehydrogenase (short-subunit alcohol dehydrogenase family)